MRITSILSVLLSLSFAGVAYAQSAPVYEGEGEIAPDYQNGAVEIYQPATTTGTITRVVEPVQPTINALIQAPITYRQDGVVKAQHYKRSDLSDAQYEALMEEAARIRTYRQSIKGEKATAPVQENASNLYEMDLYAPGDVPVVQQPQITEAEVKPEPKFAAHTVAKGDTLYNISKRYDITVAQLQDANGLSDASIKLGQTLAIPTAVTPAQSLNTSIKQPIFASAPVQSGTVTRRVVLPVVAATTPSDYAVLKSDTIYAISRRTCLSPAALIQENNLDNPNQLTPGQMLKLPEGHCLAK